MLIYEALGTLRFYLVPIRRARRSDRPRMAVQTTPLPSTTQIIKSSPIEQRWLASP